MKAGSPELLEPAPQPRSPCGRFFSGHRALAALAVLGGIELALCLYGAAAQGRHRITTSYVTALVQAVPYLLASWLILRAPARRATLGLGLGFALAFRLVALVGTEPYLSTDVYRYVWDGRVQAAGMNPYRYPPGDPALAHLRDAKVFPRINRPGARTIYPPGAEALFFVASGFGRGGVGTVRITMVLLEAVAVWALARLLAGAGLPRERVLLYAWHPLPVWEFAGSGHVDAAVVAGLALALLAAQRNRAGLAGAALAGMTLVKLFPIALFPAVYRRWGWRLPATLAGVVAAFYLPHLWSVGWRTVFDFLLHGYAAEEGIDNGERFFLLALAQRLVIGGGGTLTLLPVAGFKVAAVLALGALAAWALFARGRDALSPVRRAAALATGFTVLLSPGYAWYFAWLAVFLPFVPRPGLFWMTVASFLLYGNWLHTTLDDFFRIHCLIYLPAAALAAGEAAAVWFARRRGVAIGSGTP